MSLTTYEREILHEYLDMKEERKSMDAVPDIEWLNHYDELRAELINHGVIVEPKGVIK